MLETFLQQYTKEQEKIRIQTGYFYLKKDKRSAVKVYQSSLSKFNISSLSKAKPSNGWNFI